MKCDILCIPCYKRSLLASAIHPKDLIITSEHIDKTGKGYLELPLPIPEEVKYVTGQALRQFQCDLCGQSIDKDEECVARTLTGYRQKYVPWEERVIR